MALMKYRFYRRDSPRGTTQASVSVGPKFPTGKTNLADPNGSLLRASLQPGSGSTDLFVAANWTYTGLFNVKRHYALPVASTDIKQRFGGIEGLPTTLLYDRQGILRKNVIGFEYTDNL